MRDAVQLMDPSIMTVDACSALLPFVPQPDEISSAASYDGEMNGLDQVIKHYFLVSTNLLLCNDRLLSLFMLCIRYQGFLCGLRMSYLKESLRIS